jgi:predicted TPR repeat methyltransferase
MDDETKAILREATKLHRSGDFEKAIENYRKVVSKSDDPAPAILLANLLISAPAPTTIQGMARRAQASALAERAIGALDSLPSNKAKAALLSRHGYFLLQLAGAFRVGNANSDGSVDGGAAGEEEEGSGKTSSGSNLTATQKLSIEQAVASFEKAALLDPTAVLAWRNAAIAYRSLDRPKDVERSLREAIKCSLPSAASKEGDVAVAASTMTEAGKSSLVDLLYRHSKALKALNEHDAAISRLFDVVAVDPSHLLAGFWLRVAAADSESSAASSKSLSAATVSRLKEYVASRASGGTSSSDGAVAGASDNGVPHAYVSRLFDGYAHKFDDHLTGSLGYRTPTVLLQLALKAASAGSSSEKGAAAVRWKRCADLGCGTGLAGEQFRPHIFPFSDGGYLSGVDLSGGMIQEAKTKRPGCYDRLDVDSKRKQARLRFGSVSRRLRLYWYLRGNRQGCG